jgi:hypothetical protein
MFFFFEKPLTRPRRTYIGKYNKKKRIKKLVPHEGDDKTTPIIKTTPAKTTKATTAKGHCALHRK